jgi:hypothetical protein
MKFPGKHAPVDKAEINKYNATTISHQVAVYPGSGRLGYKGENIQWKI